MVFYMCNSTLRGYQMLLCNWVVITVAFRYAIKYAKGFDLSDIWDLPILAYHERYLGALDVF